MQIYIDKVINVNLLPKLSISSVMTFYIFCRKLLLINYKYRNLPRVTTYFPSPVSTIYLKVIYFIMLAYSLMLTSERSIGSVVFVYAILRGCMFMKRQGSTKKDVVYLGRPVPSYMSDRLERKRQNAGGGYGHGVRWSSHTAQIFLTRPSVSSCVRHGCIPLEGFPARGDI